MLHLKPFRKEYEQTLKESNYMLKCALNVIKKHNLEDEWVSEYLHGDGLSKISFRNDFEYAEKIASNHY